MKFCLFVPSQELKKHNVKDVVRVCEPTYKVEELKEEGINVFDLVFDDGTFPPNEVRAKLIKNFSLTRNALITKM